jgi:hypothetical protein
MGRTPTGVPKPGPFRWGSDPGVFAGPVPGVCEDLAGVFAGAIFPE